jgi:hypothetical protein
MKLQLTTYGKTITIETEHSDVSLEDYFEAFEGLLVQATFEQRSIREFIIELGEHYKHLYL